MHTVMIVEPNAAIRSALVDLLEVNGMGVCAAESGERALALLGLLAQSKTLPAAVVLALEPRVDDAFQFLTHRGEIAGGAQLPVVLTTTRPEPVAAMGLQYDVLRKPFDADAFLKTLRRVALHSGVR